MNETELTDVATETTVPVEFLERLAALADAEEPLADLDELSPDEVPGDAPFFMARVGHGLVSWRFELTVRQPKLALDFRHPLAGAFADDEARERDRENVRTLCRLAYAALNNPDLPDGAVRLSASCDEDGLGWSLEGADGELLREGTAWPDFLDVLSGVPDPLSDRFIRI